jgi:hypothetical protein
LKRARQKFSAISLGTLCWDCRRAIRIAVIAVIAVIGKARPKP